MYYTKLPKPKLVPALLAGILLLADGAAANPVPISVLDDDRRALVVRVLLRADDTAELVESLVTDVPPRTNIGDPPQLRVEHLDADGDVLGSRNAWDPLWEFVEAEDGVGEQKQELDQAIGVFGVPMSGLVHSVRISRQAQEDDGFDTELLTVDVSNTVSAYCSANAGVPACDGFNSAPVAVISGVYEVAAGASVLLDGSASSDPDGDPLSHAWDMDEDGIFGETGGTADHGDEIGANPLFRAPALNSGDFYNIAIELEVCDDVGACDRAASIVSVVPANGIDTDQDGVPDLADLCPDTAIPEPAPASGVLATNRWALTAGTSFEQAPPQSGRKFAFTVDDTAGCSCAQIVTQLGIDSTSHVDKGCSTSLMVEWRDRVAD